jgi:hypothetical protein
MTNTSKKVWGKLVPRYCPKNKKVWQMKRDGTLVIHHDLPSYGLEKQEMPEQN